MNPPGFSIIIPAYAAEATLAEALQSLQAQTYLAWEAIVVDDGSIDRTREIAERFAIGDARLRVEWQANAGESAARNAGLAVAKHEWLVFLDADDWLLPSYLQRMADAIAAHPEADVIHAGWVLVARDGQRSSDLFAPDHQALFTELTRRNCFAIHACAVRRSLVESVGGFDVTLKTCPDWDLWQRVARAGPCFVHVTQALACYRLSPASAGTNAFQLLTDGLRVIARGHQSDPRVPSPAAPYAQGMPGGEAAAAKLGFMFWAAGLAIGQDEPTRPLLDLVSGVRAVVSAEDVAESLFAAVPRSGGELIVAWPRLWRRAEPGIDAFLVALEAHVDAPGLAAQCKSLLMRKILTWALPVSSQETLAGMGVERHGTDWEHIAADAARRIEELRGWIAELEAAKTWHDEQRQIWHRRAEAAERTVSARANPSWRFWGPRAPRPGPTGSPFAETRVSEPVSREWGFDRGLPVDRYYIEQFLTRHALDVKGRVLEVGDNTYTRRFGADRVTKSDVLHVVPGNREATLVGDLTQADHIPTGAFDCIILTQTLQLVYDLPAALSTVHRILKPGGVLLATFPGLTRTSQTEWPGSWFWRLTPASARRLFESEFPAQDLKLASRGNVLAACAFLYGLAAEELTASELDHEDPDYDVIVTARARKAPAPVVQDDPGRHIHVRSPLTPSGASRALVLLYHRIDDGVLDPWELSVSPDRFEEQMRVLERATSVVRLPDALQKVTSGRADRPLVVITFDDGYADNRYHALPALERHGLPATVFICTDPVAHQAEFWWDTLERILLWPGTLPSSIDVAIQGQAFHRELGDSAECSHSAPEEYRRWRAWEPGPTERHRLYATLWERLHQLASHDRAAVLSDLLAWAGPAGEARPRHRALGPPELTVLAKSGLIEIGAHTIHHPALAMLSVPDQQAEIAGSRAWLEGVLERPVTSFSYPFGRVVDYSRETVSLVRQTGFTVACSNVSGAVYSGADPFQLPRIQVKNWDGEAFERQIQHWFAN